MATPDLCKSLGVPANYSAFCHALISPVVTALTGVPTVIERNTTSVIFWTLFFQQLSWLIPSLIIIITLYFTKTFSLSIFLILLFTFILIALLFFLFLLLLINRRVKSTIQEIQAQIAVNTTSTPK